MLIGTIEDAAPESDETFTIVLSNPSGGASIADATGVVTITNDDTTAGTGVYCVHVPALESPLIYDIHFGGTGSSSAFGLVGT